VPHYSHNLHGPQGYEADLPAYWIDTGKDLPRHHVVDEHHRRSTEVVTLR